MEGNKTYLLVVEEKLWKKFTDKLPKGMSINKRIIGWIKEYVE